MAVSSTGDDSSSPSLPFLSEGVPPPQSSALSTTSRLLEDALDRCRHAVTLEQQESSWGFLIQSVVHVTTTDETASQKLVVANMARTVLVDFPYASSVYRRHMDKFLDACGTSVSISTSCALIKELGSSGGSSNNTVEGSDKLPPSSILDACWCTLKRLLLSKGEPSHTRSTYFDKNSIHKSDLERLIKLIISLPTLVANACHACNVRLPLLATSSKFYARLVDCSWTVQQDDETYRIGLLKALAIHRNNAESIALGLASHHPLPSASLVAGNWTSREMTNFILALLQNCVRSMNDTGTEHREQVLTSCCALLKSASLEVQESVVHNIVLNTSIRDVSLCPVFIELLDQCEILESSLRDVAETWSQWSFCQDVPTHQQRYVSQMLLEGLQRSPSGDGLAEDPLIIHVLQGVTHRLENFLPEIRLDGMRIAQQVARRMNQELQFDELTEADEQEAAKTKLPSQEPAPEETTPNDQDQGSVDRRSQKKKKSPKKKAKALPDPDADYDSDEDEKSASDVPSTDDENDDSTVYDDELVPYSLEDDEKDLLETPEPLHLLQALELLRTSENDEHAFSHQDTALRSLPGLIRKRPDDLPDAAISLLLQVLRMENKFGIEDFLQTRQESLVALAVEEPIQVGQQMIEEVFKDGTLVDRLACFSALQEAAYELSGSKDLDKRIAVGRLGTVALIEAKPGPANGLPIDPKNDQVMRLQSKTRRKRSPRAEPAFIKNKFTPIVPIWFYSLLGRFLSEKDNNTLWSGSTGSQLLASLFRTLATFVEFAGVTGAPVLAKDLMELVWGFLDADIAEVRMAVLVSVATSMAMLPDDRALALLLQQGDSLPQRISRMSRADPDDRCRKFALAISRSILDVLGTVQNPLLER